MRRHKEDNDMKKSFYLSPAADLLAAEPEDLLRTSGEGDNVILLMEIFF